MPKAPSLFPPETLEQPTEIVLATVVPDQGASAAPLDWWVLASALSGCVLAIAGQVALLRNQHALPAVPLFVLAIVAAAWAALRVARQAPSLRLPPLPTAAGLWPLAAIAALGLNLAALSLFGGNRLPNLAWLLFAGSVAVALMAAWLADGRPGFEGRWRQRLPLLIAVGVLVLTGALLRVLWLDRMPGGVWFDEATHGLGVEHVLTDPNYRPVFVAGDTQSPVWLWYFAVPFFKLLGPTILAMRLPVAVAGVLGIAAIYFAGRELYGWRTGLIASALLTTFVWHLTFSRIAFNTVWTVSLDAVAVFFAVRALKRGSWLSAALAGVAIGVSFHMYYTSRLTVGLIAGLLLLFLLKSPKRHWRGVLQVALVAGVFLLLTASPVLQFALQHPDVFNQRTDTVTIFPEVRAAHSYAPIIQNLKTHLLMFNLVGDRNGRHNLPQAPELNVLLAGLMVLGLGLSFIRARRQIEYLLLPAWALLMLTGGVFSVSFEAPQSQRTAPEMNVMVLLCAVPLALLWESAAQAGPGRKLGSLALRPAVWLSVVPVVGLVVASGWIDVNRYFNIQQHDASVFDEHSGAATLAAQQMARLPRNTRVLLDERILGQPTLAFLAPGFADEEPFAPSELPFLKDVPTAVFLIHDNATPISVVHDVYPTATIRVLSAPFNNNDVVDEALVSVADIEGIQGVNAHYAPGGGQAVDVKQPNIGFDPAKPPVASPFEAQWRSTLVVPAYGDYSFQLQAPPGAKLLVDQQQVGSAGQALKLTMAKGPHQLEVDASVAGATPVSLLWEPPDAKGASPIPAGVLYASGVSAHGLLASYFANGTWQAPPANEQIEPNVNWVFQILPYQYPFSIEWDGELAAPVSGTYHLGTSSTDSSRVFVDGQQVVNNTQRNSYTEGQVALTAGLHALRLQFEAHTDHNHITLFWQPPGRGREVVPTDFLFPSQAIGQAEPLPSLPVAPAPSAAAPVIASAPAPSASANLKPLAVAWQTDLTKLPGKDASRPAGAALDAGGNVYVVDEGRKTLIKLDPNGQVVWTTPGSNQQPLQDPSGVAVAPDGSVWVVDSDQAYLYHFSAAGDLLGRIGGPSLAAYHPRDVAVGADGSLYVADTGGSHVLHLDSTGKSVGSLGGKGSGKGGLTEPAGLAVASDGSVLVVDASQAKITRFAPSGGAETDWKFDRNPSVQGPHIALGPDGSVWVTDPQTNELARFSADGGNRTDFGTSAGLAGPTGLAVGSGYAIVVEGGTGRVDKLTLSG